MKYWLTKVLKNLYIDYIRKNSKIVINTYDFDTLLNDKGSILDNIIKKEKFKKVIEGIENLEGNYKKVMVLSAYMDLSDKEISEMLDITEVNVRKIRSRARQLLISQMD